jgi:hypothetical protein
MRILIFIIILAIGPFGYAQQISFGVTAGGNLTLPFLQSEYEIADQSFNEVHLAPLPGYEFGILSVYHFSEKFAILNTLDFAHHVYRGKNGFYATNLVGETLWITEKLNRIHNYIRPGALLTLTFFDKLVLGSGIQMNILLWSRSNLGSDSPLDYTETINRYYKTISCSVPLKIAYQFSPFEISAEARMGIDNRIRGSESLIKEREGSLAIKLSYYFQKSSD